MKKQNKKAFSLLLAIFIVFICTLLALYILDYIIPFWRNTKWMENWVKAYYQAYWWIEIALLERRKSWNDPYFETWARNIVRSTWYYFSMISTWSSIPMPGEWNSDTDNNYNKISLKEPVQLVLKNALTWENVKFYFKVPNFTWWLALTWGTEYNVINWQLSSNDDTLIALSWSIIKWSEIYHSDFIWSETTNWTKINDRGWYKLSEEATRAALSDRNPEAFSIFYSDNCSGPSWCILKLSVVNKLESTNWNIIPYLDYKITWFNQNVANYYSVIKSSWVVYGYRRDLKVFVPQKTTVSAFDFTIFQ